MIANPTPDSTLQQSMWSVLLLNDDNTPMEFVVHVIERFFEADHESAKRIMFRVHNERAAECGVYSYEEAE
jgi:ATP-dependent Clp protease adaptor protein ClpS